MKKATLKKIKDEIESCKRPLIFFHDDSDGLASFLLIYKHIGEGKGLVVKTRPMIDEKFLRKVEEYQPDKIFIVDIAVVTQEFIDACKKTPIVWIDHHQLLKRRNIKYFNPRAENPKDNSPVSKVLYEALKENLWISIVGVIGDFYLPKFAEKFSKEYPKLLPKVTTIENARFEAKLGELISIFNDSLRGKTQEAMTAVKILTRIDDPYELLEEKTARARYIMKRYKKIKEQYDELMKDVEKEMKKQKKDDFFVYTYAQDKMSFTGGIANDVLYKSPKKKIILICREKSGEMKCGLRTGTGINVLKCVEAALKEIDGYGGGHEKACGAAVKVNDFDRFIEKLREEAKDL